MLRIPGDMINDPASAWLQAGGFCFGEYRKDVTQEPRNVLVTENTLIFVTKGAKVFRFPESEWTVPAGKAIFLRKGCYLLCESLRNDHQYESLSVFFSEAVLNDFWIELCQREDLPAPANTSPTEMLTMDMSPELEAFRNTLIACFDYHGKHLELLLKSKMQELILLLLETDIRGELLSFLSQIYDKSQRDSEFVTRSHAFAPLKLSDYARMCGKSLSTYKSDFGKKVGVSPGKWILETRLDRAHLLLQSTSKAINEICRDSGFNDVSNFNRSFKERYGCAPGELRAKNQ